MRRCVARCTCLLPAAHSGSTRRYVRGAAAHTRRYVRGTVHASLRTRGAVQAAMRTRGAVRALSSTTRSAALQRLGCSEASSREAIRDAYYKRAKACHPDQGGSAAEFRALAAAYELALRGDDAADSPDATPEHGFAADDPLAVYVRVERERAAAMRRELAEAAKLNSGGLDKGGMWWLAEQIAGEGGAEEVARPPPKLPRRQNARQSRKMSTDAKPAIFRANDEVWAALRPGDVMIRLGVTAEKVEELGLTEDKAFVDLAQLESFTLAGRPFAMVEGPNGTVQLESPIAGVVSARNETLIENPGVLARNAECVDDAWLVELDVDDDAAIVRAELETLEEFPERPPR